MAQGEPSPVIHQSVPTSSEVRLQSRWLRWLLVVSGALVILAGIQLFVFTERTEAYFAWTVVPSVSAAFLGAGYFAAVAMEWVAVRERVWASARLVAVTILVFATLTTVATLAHLDRFHFDGPTIGTVAVTWVWMGIYVAVPPLMAVFLLVQRRMPGADPPRRAPVPAWFKTVFGFHALVMLAVGALMFVAPVATGEVAWPWELTPLTGRAVAAWLLGMGFAGLVAMLWEDDWARLRPVAVSFVLLTVLQLVVVARYASALDPASVRAWVYLVYLADMLVLGVIALRAARAARREPSPAPSALGSRPRWRPHRVGR